MNEHDLDDILDDALDDLEEDKNAKNVAHVFTPAAPQKSSNNSSNNAPANNAKQAPKIASSVLPPQVQQQQQQQQQLPPNAPSAKDFQEFLKTFSANRENLVKEDANNAAASNFDPQQLNDADVDLEKLFENMGEDEKKMINAFAQEMDKFFNEVAQKAPLPQDKPQQQQQQKPAKKLNPNDPDAPELEDENDEDQKQQQGLKASIEETLNLLAKNSKEMKDKDPNSILNEEADDENVKQLMDMFGKMMGEAGPQDGAAPSGGEDGGAENEQQMFSVLEKLMESLMAPDVLRTPMEQLRKLYPDYLERNKDKLSKEEFERIKQQLDYANQICNVYETQQFPTCMPVLIELMRKMQELGQPPEELIAQLEPKGGNGPSMPSLPDLPGKCGMQ